MTPARDLHIRLCVVCQVHAGLWPADGLCPACRAVAGAPTPTTTEEESA